MPDFEITLTRVLPDKSVRHLESFVARTPPVLAVPLGIDQLASLPTSAVKDAVFPQEAVHYWQMMRRSNVELVEVLSKLESDWGITVGMQQKNEHAQAPPPGQPAAAPQRQEGAAAQPKTALAGVPPGRIIMVDKLPSMDDILHERLAMLSSAESSICQQKAQLERELIDVRKALCQTNELLALMARRSREFVYKGPKQKKRGRPRKKSPVPEPTTDAGRETVSDVGA
jgi:hypothetical protein